MESEALLRTIEATVHGRYIVQVPQKTGPWPALFSFHGYGEDAAANLGAALRIPEAADWLVVAVQALHPFYTKNERIVASWMTRQDRELAIADNIAYVRSVVDAVAREFPVTSLIVFAGFSQGVAMAYRAAAHVSSGGVIALAGDVPPDVATREGPLTFDTSSILPQRTDRPRPDGRLVHRGEDGRRRCAARASGSQRGNQRIRRWPRMDRRVRRDGRPVPDSPPRGTAARLRINMTVPVLPALVDRRLRIRGDVQDRAVVV